MKKTFFLKDNQSGAVAVIIALLMVVIVGFTAIAVDVGYLYETRRQLQSAADSAALAGAQELIKGGTEAEVLTVAEDFALKNDFSIDIDTTEELLMFKTPPETEVGENYVKVTVEKNTNLFFAKIFGIFSSKVNAQAKAQVVYVTGSRGLVPWGLIIIHPTLVTAKLEGGPEVALTEIDKGLFSDYVDSSIIARDSGYGLTVKVYNEQNFPEIVYPAAYFTTEETTSPIQKVWISNNYINPYADSDPTLYVESIDETQTPTVRFNGKNYSMNNNSGNLFSLTLPTPQITNNIEYFPVNVSIGSGVNIFTINNAAVLVVHRSTYPIKSINFSETSFIAGIGGSANVTVETLDYTFGEIYDLKVVQGAECGNFNPLDFRYIWCPTDYILNHGENENASDYYDNLSGIYSGIIHIGDIIETQPGNLSAPSTANSLQTRFGDHSTCTWESWEIDRHTDCKKIICVPIVEKMERLNGKSEVIVVDMAAFFVENIPDQGLNITGRFIEYVKPGEYSETPPNSSLYMTTVRLVSPDF